RVELFQLVPLRDQRDGVVLRAEVHAVVVPGELPGDNDRHLARHLAGRGHVDPRLAEAAGDSRDRPGVLRAVEDVHRALHLRLRVGRDRPHVAGILWAGELTVSGELLRQLGAVPRGRTSVGPVRSLAVRFRGDQAVPARSRRVGAPPQAGEDGPARLVPAQGRWKLAVRGLADPALRAGPVGAQLAHEHALTSGREVRLSALPLEHRAPTDIAHDLLVPRLQLLLHQRRL